MGLVDGPWGLAVVPIHPVVVVSVDDFDFAHEASFKHLTLTLEGLSETSGLSDLQAHAGLRGGISDAVCVGRVVDERLGADDVLSGAKGFLDVLGVKGIGGVDRNDL